MSEDESPTPNPDRSHEPGDITRLLANIGTGTPQAREELLRAVYDQLKILANAHMRSERPGHTLGATGLVNETYMRLFRTGGLAESSPFEHRQAFYQAATTAMRRILIDHTRAKLAAKRGGPARRSAKMRISIDLIEASTTAEPADLLALDEAVNRLEQEDPRAAEVVRLRFYAGRQLDEVAEILGVSERTIKRDWQYARAKLQQFLDETDPETTR